MNAQDRKEISNIISELEALQAKVEELGSQLRDLAEAEQDKFDNLPEGLQASERGEAIDQAAQSLGDAAEALETGDIGSALDNLGALDLG